MNGTSGFQEVRSTTPDHQPIGSCTSNSIDLEQVPGTFCVPRSCHGWCLTLAQRIASFLLLASKLLPTRVLAQCEKKLVVSFSDLI